MEFKPKVDKIWGIPSTPLFLDALFKIGKVEYEKQQMKREQEIERRTREYSPLMNRNLF